MLSFTCRRFRARFTPGSAHSHRRTCRECDAFAAAVERAAGVRLPLPAGLRRGLSEIAAPAAGSVLAFPVPRLPLPGSLAARLRTLAPAVPGGPPLPEWLRSPYYAVAASALLALLLGPFLSAAADRGIQAVDSVREEVSPLLERTGEEGKEEIGRLGAEARRSAEASLRRLDEKVSTWLSDVVDEESTNRNPNGEAAGSVRRP